MPSGPAPHARFRSAGGFTLLEILLATAVGSFACLCVSSLISDVSKSHANAMALIQINQFRARLMQTFSSQGAWQKTGLQGSKSGLSPSSRLDCLLNNKPCTLDGSAAGKPIVNQPFALYDFNNQLVYDSPNPATGFTYNGSPCSSFKPAGNDSCPFRYDLRWSALCPPGNCIAPQIKISAILLYAPSPVSPAMALNLPKYSINTFYQLPPAECNGSFVPFATQLGGGAVTGGSAIIHTSCATYVGSKNLVVGSGYPAATKYGPGGVPATSALVSKLDENGAPVWSSEYFAAGAIASVSGIGLDPVGNIFVAGTVTCQTGVACSFGGKVLGTTGLNVNGNSDAFLMKFNGSGVLQWVNQLGGGAGPAGQPTINVKAMSVDKLGSVYLAGGSVNALGGKLSGARGDINAYVVKFDSAGTLLWTTELGNGPKSTYTAYGITLTPSNSLVMVGQATGALLNNQLDINAHGFIDTFVATFDAAGNNTYSLQVGYEDNLWGTGVQTDAAGNIFVSGYTDGSLSTSAEKKFFNFPTQYGTHGYKDSFLMLIDPTGSFQSISQYGALGVAMTFDQQGGSSLSMDAAGSELTIAGQADNYLGGACYGTCSGISTFVTKFKRSGAPQWTTQMGKMGNGAENPFALFSDSAGNNYIAAMTDKTAALGKLFGTHKTDALAATIDTNGATVMPPSPPPPLFKPVWPLQFGAAGGTVQGNGAGQDGLQNVLVVGSTSANLGGIQFGSAGTQDAFVAMFDAKGNSLWTRQLGDVGQVTAGRGIAVAASGNSHFTGSTSGTVGAAKTGIQDIYVGALDLTGAKQWISQFGQSGAKLSSNAIAVDALGASITAGSTDSVMLPGTLYGAHGTLDALVVKFNAAGISSLVLSLGAAGAVTVANAVVVDPLTQDFYVTGTTSGSLGGAQYGGHGLEDLFVARFSSAGAFKWVSQVGGGGGLETFGNGAVVDSLGHLIAAGTTTGTAGTQYGFHGTSDMLVAAFDSTGKALWIDQVGAWNPCIGGESCNGMGQGNTFGNAVAKDGTGLIYAFGSTDGMIPGASQYLSHGKNDALVVQFDSAGKLNWSSQLGTTVETTQALGATSFGNGALGVGFTSGYLQGTQYGKRGVRDLVLFRTDPNGVLP